MKRINSNKLPLLLNLPKKYTNKKKLIISDENPVKNSNFFKNKRKNKTFYSNCNNLDIMIRNSSEKNLGSKRFLNKSKESFFDKKRFIKNTKKCLVSNRNQSNFFSSPFQPLNHLYLSQDKKNKNEDIHQFIKSNIIQNNKDNKDNKDSDINNNKKFNNTITNFKNNSLNINNSINNINNDTKFRSDSFNKTSSYLFSCLLENISRTKLLKLKQKQSFKGTVYKLSPFFKYSRNEKISSREIYKHYLRLNRKDNESSNIKENNNNDSQFQKAKFSGSYDYTRVICPRLKQVYGDNESFCERMTEIKKNYHIALKNDFNIKEYQAILMKLIKKHVSEQYLKKLEKKYLIFNEQNYGMLIPKGRYIDLAKQLKNHLSGESYEKLKRMDKNYKLYFSHRKDKDKNNRKSKSLKELLKKYKKKK